MEILAPREKKEWNAETDARWIRTGCHDIWDAIFMAFRDYREATPEQQHAIIQNKTKTTCRVQLSSIIDDIPNYIYVEDDNELRYIYRELVPSKVFHSELIPYLNSYVKPDMIDDDIIHETIEKSVLLGEYRYKKKKKHQLLDDINVSECFNTFLKSVFEELRTRKVSYDIVQQVAVSMEYHVIIVSPNEKVLFDSKTWNKGIEDADYNDVIIIMETPSGKYESIGRISSTKDGHQKVSRLFHYDDVAVQKLRPDS